MGPHARIGCTSSNEKDVIRKIIKISSISSSSSERHNSSKLELDVAEEERKKSGQKAKELRVSDR